MNVSQRQTAEAYSNNHQLEGMMALTNDEKKFLAEHIRWGKRHDVLKESTVTSLLAYGYKKSTILKYYKAITN